MGKVIGIVSLKGGVGKTSSVVSLGAALASRGKKVLLVDANLSAPNLGLHLDLVEPETGLQHVLSNRINIHNVVHHLSEFDVIPSIIFEGGNINPLRLKDKLEPLISKYDVILIDSSPALNDETLAVMLASDEILVVTTPDYSTLTMTIKAVKLAKSRNTPISGLILNKVYNKKFELSLCDIEDTAEVPIMAVIPHDLQVLRAQSEFKPSTSYSPRSRATQEYLKLAASLMGERYEKNLFSGIFGFSPKRHEVNREIFRVSHY